MSFLNPVSLPVKRFSSTDAGAPQINYAKRAAGDVKAVLKACLVTGYGEKAGAGWSIKNELDTKADFVSPIVEMSDYRLSIDDSTSLTKWSYFFNDELVTPVNSSSQKSFSYIDSSSAKNGWDLIVTDGGFYFIEQLYTSVVSGFVNRVTFFGQSKLAINIQQAKNIGFWVAGYNAPNLPYEFFDPLDINKKHYRLGAYESIKFAGVNISNFGAIGYKNSALGNVELLSPLYLMTDDAFIAQQPGVLIRNLAVDSEVFDNTVMTVHGRNALPVFLSRPYNSADIMRNYNRCLFIYLDNWEL